MVMCTAIILLHGWAVFTIDAVRRIGAQAFLITWSKNIQIFSLATMPGQQSPGSDTILGGSVVLVFVTSYLPIVCPAPLHILLFSPARVSVTIFPVASILPLHVRL